MFIGGVLKQLREAKNLSQGDIERRTGLLRCYISRVENGHTVPAIETLEKMSRALEISMYQLFYAGQALYQSTKDAEGTDKHSRDWASRGRGARLFRRLRDTLPRMSDKDRQLILATADAIASLKPNGSRRTHLALVLPSASRSTKTNSREGFSSGE